MILEKTQDEQRKTIFNILERLKITSTELARAAGLAPSTIYRFLNTDVKHLLSASTIAKITAAEASLVSRNMDNDEGKKDVRKEMKSVSNKNLKVAKPIQSKEKMTSDWPIFEAGGGGRLPILGRAMAGDEAMIFDNDKIEEYINRPPELTAVRNAYAIYVFGNSMEPRYFTGEILYINPNKPVSEGQFAIIQTMDNTALIKLIKEISPEQITYEQYNPKKEIKREYKHIKSLHLIVGCSSS